MYTTPRKPKVQAGIFWPILDLDEIITILAGFDLNLAEDQLLKPTQQVAETIYIRLVSSLLGLDLEQVADAFSQCATHAQNQSTLYDGFVLLAVQKPIFQLFRDCGVQDFCLDDILHPTPKRLRLLLSAFINYARFRECREEWALHMRQTLDEEEAGVQSRTQGRAAKLERLKELRRLVAENSLEKETALNEDKKAQLNKLADLNLELIAERNREKPHFKITVDRLKQQQKLVDKLRSDVFALRATLSKDPVALRKDADAMHQQVSHKKYLSNSLHQRAQKLEISIQSLKQFKADMDTLKSASHNLDTEKSSLQEIHDRCLRLSHFHELSSLELENGNRVARRSQHECDQLQQKIQVAREQTEKLNVAAETRMAQLRKQLGAEYGEKAVVLQNIDIINEDIASIGVASAAMKEAYLADYKSATIESERAQRNLAAYLAKVKNGVL
ncbi:putative kinetochore protein [Yarrowia sp. C11]|nr:putative kinetochore protein [Yarrowia sp. E02]KAG5369807.1 putative kinetochore protein [Yarrowia sp. C11]